MRVLFLIWSLGLTAAALSAQANAGVTPEWETRKLIDGLVANANKLEPLLNEINPANWREPGAPDAYRSQWQSVHNSLAGFKYSSTQLAKDPTKLSVALETLFRLDSVNVFLGSLATGVRRYHNPALADLVLGVADENSANRENLKQYTIELAASKEGELKVMESEAQRCLSLIVQQPPPAKPRPAAPAKDKK